MEQINDYLTTSGAESSSKNIVSENVLPYNVIADISGELPLSADKIADILKYIGDHGCITNSEAQAILELKESRTKQILRILTEQNILDRTGRNKGTKYIIHR